MNISTIALIIVSIVILGLAHKLVLRIIKVTAYAMYILCCAVVGIPLGMVIGVFDLLFQSRYQRYSARSQRKAVYRRLYYAVRPALWHSKNAVKAVGKGVMLGSYASGQVVKAVIDHSPIGMYARLYQSGKRNPYAVLRGLRYGMFFAYHLLPHTSASHNAASTAGTASSAGSTASGNNASVTPSQHTTVSTAKHAVRATKHASHNKTSTSKASSSTASSIKVVQTGKDTFTVILP